jgi:hypothetical protein
MITTMNTPTPTPVLKTLPMNWQAGSVMTIPRKNAAYRKFVFIFKNFTILVLRCSVIKIR